MSLQHTYKEMRELLANITLDLEKSEKGNKAASQRVRTGTVKLEKVAKTFRKDSVSHEKKTKGQKKPTKTAAKKAAHHAPAKKAAAHHAPAKKAAAHHAPAKKAAPAKAKAHASVSRARPLAVKRPTAKLPAHRLGAR